MYDSFFFKQKTAYEMRISYWSSDVCSSDLSTLSLIIANSSVLVPKEIPFSVTLKNRHLSQEKCPCRLGAITAFQRHHHVTRLNCNSLCKGQFLSGHQVALYGRIRERWAVTQR